MFLTGLAIIIVLHHAHAMFWWTPEHNIFGQCGWSCCCDCSSYYSAPFFPYAICFCAYMIKRQCYGYLLSMFQLPFPFGGCSKSTCFMDSMHELLCSSCCYILLHLLSPTPSVPQRFVLSQTVWTLTNNIRTNRLFQTKKNYILWKFISRWI